MCEDDPPSEDTERTLIFMDMLGAAALTEKFPARLMPPTRNELGGESISSSQTSDKFSTFAMVVDRMVFDARLNGDLQAMLFSDCAFVELGNSFRACSVAVEMMRDFIQLEIPVRMGIGKGTFYPTKFSTDVIGATIVTRSLFFGTAVVRAHAAEKCGGKGMRIFLDKSVESDFGRIKSFLRPIRLVTPHKNVMWELDFLNESVPFSHHPSAGEKDQYLFDAVLKMQADNASEPQPVQEQYTQTLEAMNRMCRENGRPQRTF